MDKHTNTKIKIKINGDERPFKQDVAIHNWNSNKDEAAAASEQMVEDDQFDWVLPEIEENPISEFKKIYYEPALETAKLGKKFKKNSSSPLITILVSAAMAISIGVLLGYIMLKVIAYQSEGESQKTLGNQNSIPAVGSIKKTEYLTLPSLSPSVIQGGVYDNASAAANEMKAKGLPTTIIPIEGKQYIFIGISNKLETAKLVAEKLKKQKIEVYVKQLTIKELNLKVTTKDEQTFANQTTSLFQKMADVTSNAYLTGSLNEGGLAEISNQYKGIQELKDLKNNKMKNLFTLQAECYKHLLNYQKNNEENEISDAQQALLSYIEQYNEM